MRIERRVSHHHPDRWQHRMRRNYLPGREYERELVMVDWHAGRWLIRELGLEQCQPTQSGVRAGNQSSNAGQWHLPDGDTAHHIRSDNQLERDHSAEILRRRQERRISVLLRNAAAQLHRCVIVSREIPRAERAMRRESNRTFSAATRAGFAVITRTGLVNVHPA
jgi:hypothetical protein